MTKLTIHLISEFSGQTVKQAAKSALMHFCGMDVNKYHWLMIKNEEMLEEALLKIKRKPGIILYTIVNPALRGALENFCRNSNLPHISITDPIVSAISSYLGVESSTKNIPDKFDENYFDKLDAIKYSFKHDDGQSLEELDDADVIIIGSSRTSKTPTSVYLAYNGFKTANIPYIHGVKFPDVLEKVRNVLIVGLVISPAILTEIRENRMKLLQGSAISDYTDLSIIHEECKYVKMLCAKNNWPIIDVSRRSIEETAAIIMKAYYDYQAKLKT